MRASTYRDSVVLLRLAETLRDLPGIREAACLLGTPANHGLLAAAGLGTPETARAGPTDLVIAVDAESEVAADSALRAAAGLLAAEAPAMAAGGGWRPRTLDGALRQLPGATLVAVSVPGAYAGLEARRALARGRHVFLFSDNVPLAEEVRLKRLAAARGLLCMGPDCGTAYVNGVGLGFANVVPRGRVGLVAASGTGLQAVACHLAGLGEGVSQGIGVGGRDLSAEVGGLMTLAGLAALARDPATALVVLVTKPPAAGVLPRVEAALAATGKPAVACCLGAAPPADPAACWVATLEEAAIAAAARLRGVPWAPRPFTDPAAVRAALAAALAAGRPRGGTVLGLFTGGTLAHEARLVLGPLVGCVEDMPGAPGVHRVIDLGADAFTLGHPHPMLDPLARAARVRAAGSLREVGVLLLDLVLGRGVHRDPAGPLAEAVVDARAAAARDGRALAAVASVVGTADDPQGLRAQVGALAAAGVDVMPSNAQAARLAALLVRPALAGRLLGDDGP